MLPDKEEGFDEIKFDWSKKQKCAEYLKAWVLEKKNTTRIEDLKPSEWFNTEWTRWQKTMQTWHSKQNEHRAAVAKKEADKAAKAAKKAAAKAMAERKKAAEEAAKKRAEEEEAAKAEAKEKSDDNKDESKDDKMEGKPAEADAEKKNEEKAEGEEEEEDEEDMSKVVDFEGVDIFGIEDVSDIGDTSPLFKMFGFEDWAMLGLRYELNLLSHAFTKDADDPDRKGVHLDHLGFYYQKYFKKALNLKFYGLETNPELVSLVEDTIRLRGNVIESRLPQSLESLGIFVKITEESRRDRTRLIDLGDESAKLKIQSGLQSSLAPVGGGGGFGGGGVKGGFVQPVGGKSMVQNIGFQVQGKLGGGKGGGGGFSFGGGGSAGGGGSSGGSWGWNNKSDNNKGGKAQSFGARPAPYSFGDNKFGEKFGGKKGGEKGGEKGGGKSYGKSWSK